MFCSQTAREFCTTAANLFLVLYATIFSITVPKAPIPVSIARYRFLYPAPASKLIEILTGIRRPVQRT